MPWHDAQVLKITARTGPFGGSTCGRVGLLPNCANTGAAAIENTRKNLSVLCVLSGCDIDFLV